MSDGKKALAIRPSRWCAQAKRRYDTSLLAFFVEKIQRPI